MIKMLYRRLIVVGLSFLVSTAVLAQGPERVTLSLDNADIRDLINWAADFTGKNIIVHPNVKGKVTVVAGDPMTHDEAFDVFMSVLQVNGFSLVEQGGTWKVVPDALAKQQAIPVADENTLAPAESLVVRTVRVENISAAQLIAMLRPLIPQTGHLAAYADTNTLIIADRAANIDQIVRLVRQLDRAGAIDIEVVPLLFASAKEVKQVLNELLQSGGGKQAGREVQPLRIAVDERSNSILLTGDPVTRQQIKTVIGRLDQPLDGDGNTAVVYVQYANAADLKPILEGMSGSIQNAEKDQQAADVEVSIQVNESLNSLVLTAPPALLETMKGVIAKLDVRRAQVLIEALIVEVTEGTTNELGISWIAGADDNVVAGWNNTAGVDAEGNPNPFSLPISSLTGLNALHLGYLSGTDIRLAINALATEANANILSTPTIMALDNEEAEILVGENVPFITGEQLLSGSNDDPFTTIQRQDVGTSLKVTPRVNNNNSVTLEIEQKVEDVLPAEAEEETGASDIITSKREIRTKVLIDDGAILVLGGLMRDKVTDSIQKVPLLGDIPGIGRLFRNNTKRVDKTNLMVFLRPKILSTQVAGYEETRKYYMDMQQKQIFLKDRTSLLWDWHRGDALPDLMPPTGTYNESPAPVDGSIDGGAVELLDEVPVEVLEIEEGK
ncbi:MULTISPECIES: type II secretion system secretin GspD [unclassified Microbulbifer]|uniref:Type II secretion system secretin GspD n=1 Tax=Microbulbifer spongiae TaxID=2944933 RepID=A0ABY9EDS8_9GAMM|nr:MULTISPECIES: type II secretion system secretin GspD [unclassified Microbulbifer]MDP5209062.1 type II secretion system secretin GspD [Microbulbifer sp. 2205BS26-8]WKD51159.1 type II secretion system secretin GspD [Microbulbifer sp. MI-G]